jgi:hypothetical protein
MIWRSMRDRLRNVPERRWAGDLIFVPVAAFAGVMLARTYDSFVLGIGVAVLVLAVRYLVYFLMKARRRPE